MISLIVAMTKDRVIGLNGSIPWYIPSDLRNFKEVTMGTTLIMGNTTYKSLNRINGLPHRRNIVITKTPNKYKHLEFDNLFFVDSVDNALKLAKSFKKDIFVIGGESIYQQFITYVEFLYLSIVKSDCGGDTYFPDIDWSNWQTIINEDKGEYIYKVMHKIKT